MSCTAVNPPYRTSASEQWRAGREAETQRRLAAVPLDFDVDKTGPRESVRERLRLDWDADIARVQLTPLGPVEAVDTDQQSTWSEDSAELAQQTVLAFGGWHVVQHREARGCRKALVLERERSRIGVNHFDVVAGQT